MHQGYRVTCSRCGGSGRLAQHSTVLGGVCFGCKGGGFCVQKSPPSAPAIRFGVSACSLRTGERVSPVFWLRAKSERQALTKARAQIAKGNGYDPATVAVSTDP